MKFDLVLQKLWMIWLVQEIREPNHADHVIGHLAYVSAICFASDTKQTLTQKEPRSYELSQITLKMFHALKLIAAHSYNFPFPRN